MTGAVDPGAVDSGSVDPGAVDLGSVDLESSGLLDGLVGEDRSERAELIHWLFDQGITVEEIRNSFAPMLLAARRVLGDDGTYLSARQISEQVGIGIDELNRFQRASGQPQIDDPDSPAFMRSDGDTALHIKRFLDLGIDPDQLLTIVRVLAEGLSRAAEVMRAAALGPVFHPGVTELEIAKGTRDLVSAAAPMLGPMSQDMLLLQLRHEVETGAVNASERRAGAPLPGARDVACAFADLVGFTRLGEELPPEGVEQLANRLADIARQVLVAPVRLIKTIGDAVMLISPDTGTLLEVILALVDAAEADELLPQLRVGVAYGSAVSRAGDWFGSPVNVASRVTSVARPGAVLVTESAREQITDDRRFLWSYAGVRRLRGIRDGVDLYRVRPGD